MVQSWSWAKFTFELVLWVQVKARPSEIHIVERAQNVMLCKCVFLRVFVKSTSLVTRLLLRDFCFWHMLCLIDVRAFFVPPSQRRCICLISNWGSFWEHVMKEDTVTKTRSHDAFFSASMSPDSNELILWGSVSKLNLKIHACLSLSNIFLSYTFMFEITF